MSHNQLDVKEYFNQLGYGVNDAIALREFNGKGYSKSALPNITCALKDLDFDRLRTHNSPDNQDNPYAIYALPNGGHRLDSTTSVRSINFEWDDVPKEDQWQKMRDLGLEPYISMAVDTGRKSLHFYMILQEPVEPELGSQLAKDVAAYCKSDPSVATACQPMRLPGFYHHQKGLEPKLSSITYKSGVRTTYDDLRKVIPVSNSGSKSSRKAPTKATSKGVYLGELIAKVEGNKPGSPKKHKKVLADAYNDLASVTEGNRNNALFKAGCKLGRYLLRGLSVAEGFNTLLKASEANGLASEGDVEDTILRALDTGFESAIDERDRPLVDSWAIQQPDQIIEQQYVEVLPFGDKPHLILKSQKGTGKTRALKGFIQQMQDTGVPVISIGHRCVLLNEQAAKLGLDYYEDLEHDLGTSKNLAITLDSLHKVNLGRFKGAVIVLDEASQILKHLIGNTEVRNTRRPCLEALENLCSNASHIVALDADMAQTDVDFFSRFVARDTINVVVNTTLPAKRKYLQYPDQSELYTKLLAEIDDGKNQWVYSSSKTGADTFEGLLKKDRPDLAIITITSDNSKNADIQHFMRNINHEVTKYRVVIASPSLGTGVDVEETHIHSVFAYVSKGDHLSASDIMQGVARVRNPIDKEVHFFAEVGFNDVEQDPIEIRKQVDYLTEPNAYKVDKKTGDRVLVDAELHNLYLELYCAKSAQHNASVKYLRNSLEKLIRAEGHNLVALAANLSDDDKKATNARHTEAAKEVRTAQCKRVVAARDIDAQEAENIKNQLVKSPEKQASLDKYYVKTECGLKADEVNAEWVGWYQGGGKQYRRAYIDQFVKRSWMLKEADASDRKSWGKYQSDQGRREAIRDLRHKLMPEEVLRGQGVTHEWLVESGWLQTMEDNKEAMIALLKIKPNTKKPIQTLNKVLAELGLSLVVGQRVQQDQSYIRERKKTVGHKKRARVYNLNPESLDRMEGIAKRTLKDVLQKAENYLEPQSTLLEPPIPDPDQEDEDLFLDQWFSYHHHDLAVGSEVASRKRSLKPDSYQGYFWQHKYDLDKLPVYTF